MPFQTCLIIGYDGKLRRGKEIKKRKEVWQCCRVLGTGAAAAVGGMVRSRRAVHTLSVTMQQARVGKEIKKRKEVRQGPMNDSSSSSCGLVVSRLGAASRGAALSVGSAAAGRGCVEA